MGVFLDYVSIATKDLINEPTTILSVGSYDLNVYKIWITNRTNNIIRFNLQQIKTFPNNPDVDPEIMMHHFREEEIAPRKKLLFELPVTLTASTIADPPYIETLVSFSNGYTQVYDIQVYYSVLKELPIT